MRRAKCFKRVRSLRSTFRGKTAGVENRPTLDSGQPETRNPKLETRNSRPETFFDADFLKKLERLHLIAKRLDWAGLKGEHAASRKGYSLEFSDYRRYQRGDDLRYVDWNIYRRLDRLVLKVFTAEEEMNIYLLVDTSASMASSGTPTASAPPPAKIDYAKRVAAALGYIGLKNLDRVGGARFRCQSAGAAQAGPWTNADSSALRFSRRAFLRRCHRPPGGHTQVHDLCFLNPGSR